jgi:hypothetical protein
MSVEPISPESAEPEALSSRRIGTDEWVAQAEQRQSRRSGLEGALLDRWEAIPPVSWIAFWAVVLLLAPPLTNTSLVLDSLGISNNDFILRIGAISFCPVLFWPSV